jgi:hypothetical protein
VYQGHAPRGRPNGPRPLTGPQRVVLAEMLDRDLMLQQHDDLGAWLVARVGEEARMNVNGTTFLSLYRARLIQPVGVSLPPIYLGRPCNYYRVSTAGRATLAVAQDAARAAR